MIKSKKVYSFDDSSYNYIRDCLANDLKLRIEKFMNLYKYKKIIILCVGTDKCILDSYGPIIGSRLIQSDLPLRINVIGTLGNTLNASNLTAIINENAKNIDKSLVIAIDSTISHDFHCCSIIVNDSGIFPAAAIGKKLPYIGDISICGVNFNPYKLTDLININSEKIIKMCDITADALYKALMEIKFEINPYNENKIKSLSLEERKKLKYLV